MVKQGFHIGDRDWWVMGTYGIDGERDLYEVYEALLSIGIPDYKARKVCMELSKPNSGYTLTDFGRHFTLMFVSRATSAEQMFDSVVHELKHLTEHIGAYYGIDPEEELSAYLQGEVGRKMWPAVALVLCPECNHPMRTSIRAKK